MAGAPAFAEQSPGFVGRVTLAIGAALVAAPAAAGRPMGLDPGPARVFGIADLSLVPGLLLDRRPGRWMAARGAMNVAMAAYYLVAVRPRNPKLAKRTAASLGLLTVADSAAAFALLRAEREAG